MGIFRSLLRVLRLGVMFTAMVLALFAVGLAVPALAQDVKPLELFGKRPKDQAIIAQPQPGTAPTKPTPAKQSPNLHTSSEANTPTSAAGNMPVLKVRAGEHGTFDRLVFDWKQPVNYRINRVDDRMIIRFDRRARADLSSIKFMELPYGAGVVDISDQDGFALQIDLPAGAEIKDNRLDQKVMIDIVHRGRSKPARPTARALAMTKPSIKLQPSQAGKPVQPVAGLKTPPKPEQPSAQTPPPAVAAVPALDPVRSTDGDPKVDFNKEAEKASQIAVAAQAPEPKSQAERLKADPATITHIRIDPGQQAGAVVFLRGGWLWFVINMQDVVGMPLIQGPMASRLQPIERIVLKNATAFRMPVVLGQYPSVTLDGRVWQVSLSPVIVPGTSARIDISTDLEGQKSLSIGLSETYDAINLVDPDVGDNLMLIPTGRAGDAVRESRRLPQFEFLPAFQGVVLRPLVDELAFENMGSDLAIRTEGGLLLSADRRALLEASPESGIEGTVSRLFDINRWMRGSIAEFDKNRIMLQHQIADIPRSPEQIVPLLDLARLHFAHGFAPETSGLIKVAAGLDSDIVNKPEVMALRGAARALYGDGVGAIQDLSITAIADNPEASLWRGVGFARQGLWKRAGEEFEKSGDLLFSYPDALFNGIAGLNVEALLFANKTDAALKILDEWQDRGKNVYVNKDAIDYLRGDILLRKGEEEEGLELWRKVAEKGRDHLYGVKAAFGLIDYALANEDIDRKTAIEQLDRLRFAWRGDTLELAILRRLGNLRLDESDYHGGLQILQRAVDYFPGSAQSEQLTQDMVNAFNKLFIADESEKMSPIVAYGLYDQFRELTPIGSEGDAVVEKLAKRLVGADLLTEAGNILQHQVEFRLEGTERARVGTHLAGVRLLDQKPKQAIEVLDFTESDVVDPAMRLERLMLRAKATEMDGKPDQALALLGVVRTSDADRLRVDIAWRSGRWAAASEALGRLIGDPPPEGAVLSPEKVAMVMNRAVALSLAMDQQGIDDLRQRFTPAMELSPMADGFRLLVRPGSDALNDLDRIRKQVSEVDLFGNFMSQYRNATGQAKPAG